jgi:NADH-quinone oxidoreductase subunit L
MADDEGMPRFFSYLNLFLFSMLMLVLGGNLLVLFVGWEGVGLCSYLLIGFWFRNLDYCAAGRKAFVVNRIGDAGVLLGIFLLLMTFKTVDFVALSDTFSSVSVQNEGLAGLCAIIGFCLFVGATGKSAQLPLFVWLPDAMAGPTPVSALIHAATMVTAGIYLFARMAFLFDAAAPDLGLIVVLVAAATAFISATIAVAQNDIKKVLAYSTVSQLGFMFLAAGAGAYWVALFHVITHAFFKACLFLGAGSVIHGCHHEQDMRQMGGLRRLMPLTFVTYLISTLAIAGIYPFAGFHSKHAIFDALAHSPNPLVQMAAPMVLVLASLTAGLTAFYMTRSLVLTFFGEYRGHAHPHESPARMVIPLIVLALLATGGGVFLEHYLPEYLSAVLPRSHAHPSLSPQSSVAASWIGLLGVALGALFFGPLRVIPARAAALFPAIHRALLGKYFIDELYRAVIVRPLEVLSSVLWSGVDKGIIDATVNGTGEMVEISGEIARTAQTGEVRHYALYLLVAAATMIGVYLVF